MGKLVKKPAKQFSKEEGRFERFNLKENPFPATPFVIRDASDKRINGDIFETEIRKIEYDKLEQNFLRIPQPDMNHLRLGYILDTSYVGRGNGKSAFLINVQKNINEGFCLDISEGSNKCFAVYMSPESGGRTKTFDKFLDMLFYTILNSGIINKCLTVIRLEAVSAIKQVPVEELSDRFADENEMVEKISSSDGFSDWLSDNNISWRTAKEKISDDKYLRFLPAEFPLHDSNSLYNTKITTQDNFKDFYDTILKRPDQKREFIFSHLVNFFRSADFNGSYIFVDDFERIIEFQSARQKKDFAFELRSCLFDGLYTNAKIGFYNMILVLHAGVPRAIEESWSNSGMEHRAPISSLSTTSRHIIPFEKLDKNHVKLLLKKYVTEFRINSEKSDDISPFIDEAINKIAEVSEFNAAKILKLAYELLDKAADIPEQNLIDKNFVDSFLEEHKSFEEKPSPRIPLDSKTTDLREKAMMGNG